MASSIDQLNGSNYFYDQSSGLLFLDVVQQQVNGSSTYSASGGEPSPLGSCGGASPDKSCPDFKNGESFYSCPSGGCELYMVQVSSSAYAYDPTNTGTQCSAYPQYAQSYPSGLHYLKNTATGGILNAPSKFTVTGGSGNFPHLEDATGNPCP
jgi:hypothetical protein